MRVAMLSILLGSDQEPESDLGLRLGLGLGLGIGLSFGLRTRSMLMFRLGGGRRGSVPVATPDSVHRICSERQLYAHT